MGRDGAAVSSKVMTVARALLAAGAFLLSLTLMSYAVSAAIRLNYFIGSPGDGYIQLEWQTATETNTAGFYIMRWNDSLGRYEEYSEFIPATGSDVMGDTYFWPDRQVTDGVTYYYMLEELARDRSRQPYGLPVTVTMGLITPTPSPTPSQTPTQTLTPTPTSTLAHGADTLTPVATASPIASFTPTATSSPEVNALSTNTPPSPQTAAAATSVPSDVVAITTATLAISTSQANVTATRTGVLVSPIPTGAAQSTPLPGQTPSAPNATRPVPKPSATPVLAPTQVSGGIFPWLPGGQPVSPDGSAVEISGGTNWTAVGVAMGMFALAAILIAGAVLIIRLLLR